MNVNLKLSDNFGIGMGFVDFEVAGLHGAFRTRVSNIANSADTNLFNVFKMVQENMAYLKSVASVGVEQSASLLANGYYSDSMAAWYDCPFKEIKNTGVRLEAADATFIYFFPYA